MQQDMLDLHYFAGLWEGEGCFSWGSNGRFNGGPKASLAMTDRDVIEHAAALLNQWLPPAPPSFSQRRPEGEIKVARREWSHKKSQFVISLGNRRTLHLMALLRPFMHTRRQAKIDELFARWESR